MVSDQSVIEFLENPVNFLYAADWRGGVFRFVPAGRQALSELPFLDNRTLGTSRRQGTLAIDRVTRLFGRPENTCDFIFHSAFCCSTLIARALDHPGRVLSLKEPLAVLNLSGLLRDRGKQAFSRLAPTTLGLLARPFSPSERTLVKPSNGANNLLPEILRTPGTGRVLLLYGGLEAFLVSVVSGGRDRQDFVDGILKLFLKDFAAADRVPDAKTLGPLERAALVWGLQLARFTETAGGASGERVKTLAAEKFLADPGGTLRRLSEFFGYGFEDKEITQILDGPLLATHAKETRPFDPRAAEAEQAKLLKTHKQAIEAAAGFLDGLGLANPNLKNPL